MRQRYLTVMTLLAILLPLYGLWTWQMNILWSNEIGFLLDQVEKAPQKLRPYCNLMSALNAHRAHRDALRIFEQALKVDSSAQSCWLSASIAYQKTGQFLPAIQSAVTAIKADAGCVDCRQVIGISAIRAGKYGQALEALEWLEKNGYRDGPLMALMGMAHYRSGQSLKARYYWEKCLAIDPENSMAQEGLSRLKP